MKLDFSAACIAGLFTLALYLPAAANAQITLASTVPASADVLVDVRTQHDCQQISLAKARCLAVEDLLAGHGRLANFSGLFWLLGTLGLEGHEQVAVVGNRSWRREFIAGWLYIAGQSHIDIVTQPMTELLASASDSSPGRSRAITRTAVFGAAPRTDLLVLKSELVAELSTAPTSVIVDGRAEKEYWGKSVRALRGGHLPGASHEPSPASFANAAATLPVAYAHDSVSGLAYLARLTAHGINARLYAGGWVEWAADMTLPVDAETFPRAGPKPRTAMLDSSPPPKAGLLTAFRQFEVVWVLLVILLPLAYMMGRRRGQLQ